MSNSALLGRIDSAIAEKNVLKHPFYLDWQAGKLTHEALQLYAAQYYRHVEAFPKHLRALAARANGPLHDIVMENLAEEENPAAPHPKMWQDFAASLGVTDLQIAASQALPGTHALVETFRNICVNRSLPEAVAALYAYESQVPEVAATKIDGLHRFYGITDPRGTAYFSVHAELDKVHRQAWRVWLEDQVVSVCDEQVLATTHLALDALWSALTAVHNAAV